MEYGGSWRHWQSLQPAKFWHAIGARGDISIAEWSMENLCLSAEQPTDSESAGQPTEFEPEYSYDSDEELDWTPHETTPPFMKGAARAGKLAMLDWACTQGILRWTPHCARAVADGAVSGGSLDAVKWLHKQLGSSDDAFRQATINRSGVCELDLRAAGVGCLDILKWLKEHGLLMDPQHREESEACSNAAAGCNDPNVIAWLRAEGYGWGSDICYNAAMQGHLEVLKDAGTWRG
ncbi:hypothetical protein JKP88DRAFT_351583 [Tribonema minus]|uniref:Uncharacterized protein n=1 Tax=Tribonema minus TaxID=303371 RepID=A0A835YKC7_9STRA|nr:hypothetical protein JKP88DRAFT_351583 [Tribonema minus]